MNICQQSLRITCPQHCVTLICTVIICSVMWIEVPWFPTGTLLIIQVPRFRSISPNCHLRNWQSVKSISGSHLSWGNRALLIGPAAESCQSFREERGWRRRSRPAAALHNDDVRLSCCDFILVGKVWNHFDADWEFQLIVAPSRKWSLELQYVGSCWLVCSSNQPCPC